jgi:hypothetical protein
MELIIGFLLAVLGMIAAAVSRQLADEFKAWIPWITKHLVRRAVRKLPEDQRSRYEEEWSSYLVEVPGELGKLVAALGFAQASRCMALGVTPVKRAAHMAAAGVSLLLCCSMFLFILALVIG